MLVETNGTRALRFKQYKLGFLSKAQPAFTARLQPSGFSIVGDDGWNCSWVGLGFLGGFLLRFFYEFTQRCLWLPYVTGICLQVSRVPEIGQ